MIDNILKIIRFSNFLHIKRLIILQMCLSFPCESITQGEYI